MECRDEYSLRKTKSLAWVDIMIEGINSGIANAVVNRGVLAQQAAAQSGNLNAASTTRSENGESAFVPPVRPVIRVQPQLNLLVLEFRDTGDNEVVSQIPTEAQLESFRSRSDLDEARQLESFRAENSTQNREAESEEAGSPEQTLNSLSARENADAETLSSAINPNQNQDQDQSLSQLV